ncbi:NAD(P)-binding protein [Microstroma glucosiphilum]|uniref:Short-chain dehydrogenase/reductase 3 n=1 Tax=Pseudomicrostroma glucosiphilum TaxID=1684307 RepID=A0A316UEM8_9BASI|nr:NAD(P)-binding protein [Pseudomicrostroma glucosiphilum]PWN23354.1 NAD(P)-binding protein [Pseudomicrostroma glucosiphilum]
MSSATKANASEAGKTQPSQASRPSDLDRREPFTIDVLVRWIRNAFLNTPFLLALPALVYYYDKKRSLAPSAYPDPSLSYLRHLLFTEYKWVGRWLIFGLIKKTNDVLNRYVANLGAYRADKADWSKEVVVITGGSAGIGKAVVEILSHVKKAKVAVLDMAPPTYAPAPAGVPPIQYYKTDVSDPAQVKAAADQIRASLGEPTMLMNNAGLASGDLIIDVDPERATRLWKVNTLANWITCQEFLPHMISKNHGHVMTVASSGSFMSLPQMSEYSGTKSAVLAFFEILRGELRSRYFAPRVRASLCAPTKVRTSLGEGMEDHKMPFIHPNLEAFEVARKIVDAFDSGLSQYIVMPGLMRILPLARGLPDWGKRFLELAGKTDQTVSDTSMKRAFEAGYGKDWSGPEAEARKKALERMQKRGGASK